MKRKDEKLRIAVLVKRFVSSGGAERYAVEVTRRLLERGHKIDLFAREAENALLDGIQLYPVKNTLRFSSVLNSVAFASETEHMLRGRCYDVIHSHERGYVQDVLTIHTFSYKGGVSKYSPLKKLDRVYLSPRSLIYLWLEKKQMSTPYLAAVSPVIAEDIQKYYRRSDNVKIITPGVDDVRFHPVRRLEKRKQARESKQIGEDETVILFAGSEFRRKGLDLLIPLVGSDMRLFVVGKGERLKYYQKLASDYGVGDRVHFEGLANDIMPYYALADVVVLPSISEAFGMTVLEGMACGLPVIVSENCGASMVVDHGLDGFVLSGTFDLKEILKKMTDSEFRNRIGRQAREKAGHYTWDQTTSRYEDLYYQLSEEKGFRCSD